MALNKYMHPRNIYKTPPDFEKLSKTYEEFSRIAKMDLTGKISIDFKDPHSLRILTKYLLKSDFNLDIEIPEDRLVPTLPLRLNYILWIEDLMAAIERKSKIRGIDIGTGACAVYPLLAVVKNKWHMVATETDPTSLQKSEENVARNNLQQFIQITNTKGTKLIECLFMDENKECYDFCMCNPPFYSNLQELYESRSPARLPPKNGFTGSPQELITEGGELKFCRQLIDESKRCKDCILIFTTMVGHKYNLAELLQDLKADGIKHTHTEFCQGRVTRWGLAWTYQDYDLNHLVSPRDKPRKQNVPQLHVLPPIPNCIFNIETAYNKIKTLFTGLQIEQRILNKCGNRISLDIIARENTWSNQRRKKRLLKRMETTNTKKWKSNDGSGSIDHSDPENININEMTCDGKAESINMNMFSSDAKESGNVKKYPEITDLNGIKPIESKSWNDDTSKAYIVDASKLKNYSDNSIAGISPHQNTNSTDTEPLVHAFMKLFKKDDTVQLEIEFINGTGGKESVYQIIQYIKNNWK